MAAWSGRCRRLAAFFGYGPDLVGYLFFETRQVRRSRMIKNSVGIWAFGPAVTRFVPPGYHNEVAGEPMMDKTRRVCEGLSDVLDGLEYHSPGEVNEENLAEIQGVLKEHGMDLPVVAAGLHPDPTYGRGA